MDDLDSQKANIKEYVLLINSNLDEDDELLDYVIDSVVERAVVFMNRVQLDNDDVTDFYDVDETVPPILPSELERVLAEVVVGAYRTVQASPTANKEVNSIADNGQSISYSDKMSGYLSGSDADIFSSSLELLKKYRLPTIVEPTYRF